MFVWFLKFILDGTAEKLLQPARFKILRYMKQVGEPLSVQQIADALKIHPRLVSHHMDVMVGEKLVVSEYQLTRIGGSTRQVAKRMCMLTAKADAVLQDIADSVHEVV